MKTAALALLALLSLPQFSFAQTEESFQDSCIRLERLQKRMEPLLVNGNASSLEAVLINDNSNLIQEIVSSAGRYGAMQIIKRVYSLSLSRALGVAYLALKPKELGDGTVSGSYSASSQGFMNFLSLPTDTACMWLGYQGPSGDRLRKLFKSADRYFTTARVRCEKQKIESQLREITKGLENYRQTAQPDGTFVSVPHKIQAACR